MTTGRSAAAAAILCALALPWASSCELIVRPDDVAPPGERADAGAVRPDASCAPTRQCGAGSCGVIADDGCGRPLNCGKCLAGQVCEANACVQPCTAQTDAELCAAAQATCGSLTTTDRCGKPRTVTCGGGVPCPSGTVCGGDPARPNTCAQPCTPQTCPAHAKVFGCAADGTCVATECEAGWSVCEGACCGWQVDTVTASTAGGRLAIAVDASDVSHVAFWASGSKEVRWGKRNATGSWTVETVDPTGTIGEEQIVSVAVTPNAEPALLYLDGKGNLRLAERRKNGTSGWTKSTVLAATNPLAPALAAQADGTLHAIFGEDGFPSTLYYATRAPGGSAWTQETIDEPESIALATAIALDAAGQPALAAMEVGVEANFDDTAYYFYKGASWIRERVQTGELGYSVSLATGALGAHLGFARSGYDTLVHATRGTAWQVLDVLPNSAEDDACLVLDKQGNPHFAYVSSVTGSLRHAYLVNGSWVSEQVDADAAGVAAAVDQAGRLRIAYRSSATGVVKHAWVGK